MVITNFIIRIPGAHQLFSNSVHPDISIAGSARHPHSHGKRFRSQCARQRRSTGDGLLMMSHSLPPLYHGGISVGHFAAEWSFLLCGNIPDS